MQKVIYLKSAWRAVYPFLCYIVLVMIGVWLHQGLRSSIPVQSSWRPSIYAICGPALGLETHMVLLVFPLQSLLLVPLLYASIRSKDHRPLFGVAFVVCWLGAGWMMHDLFL